MADWASVRVMSEQRKDFSGVDSRTPEKYFHESTFHPHYDGRFASKPLPYKEKLEHLRPLIQTYLSTMNDIGAETWIMHGTLIGWYWNRKTMPWDSDADVMMSEKSIEHLASYYNMTVHHYKIPGVAGGRDYMLEINPRWTNNSTEDKHNVIDGRWVDTSSGLFIDITTLRVNETARQEGIEGAMMCKDKHHYMYDDIFPLRESTFEDVPVKVPFAYAELIEAEYGAKAITKTTFEHHKFDPKTKEWVSLR
ncbi:hypothetical protein K431DRAFT_319011 [Polychaeton citri CBS 116435]|uniref:LicD/FKTN/FKRP nucleotidyltransferase domain-containing protein n=1 Tax=Polychaeton citri CBS 116435 TaxID=1314669 RepID=A0A9P4QAC5_9PEZI|nr:hypothetical protein K431DRAFT_319011 [Polychaeton citri CBS 116435]